MDTLEDLDRFAKRIQDAGLKLDMRVMHETVESIYVRDPNDILIEIASSAAGADRVRGRCRGDRPGAA